MIKMIAIKIIINHNMIITTYIYFSNIHNNKKEVLYVFIQCKIVLV